NKHKPWIETSYHGVITENTDTVLLDPPLVALDKDAPVPYAGEICAFQIHGQDAPFEAVVLNRTSGEGLLRASGPVDCEGQKEYTFVIQAYDCGADPTGADWKKSHKAVVHIQVDDVNEFSPAFRESEYKASVTEGRIYDSILQRVNYEPGTGSRQLFPKLRLETCGGPLSSARATVELQTSHIGKGCDRETYSEKSLQKLCGEGGGEEGGGRGEEGGEGGKGGGRGGGERRKGGRRGRGRERGRGGGGGREGRGEEGGGGGEGGRGERRGRREGGERGGEGGRVREGGGGEGGRERERGGGRELSTA
ncbi:hypothetical protein CRUP_015020, partial [Coryphaenoides rupestris]